MGKTFKESPKDVVDRIFKRSIDRRILECHKDQNFRKINKRKKKIKENDYYEQERD
jgi:hypothetical protein